MDGVASGDLTDHTREGALRLIVLVRFCGCRATGLDVPQRNSLLDYIDFGRKMIYKTDLISLLTTIYIVGISPLIWQRTRVYSPSH